MDSARLESRDVSRLKRSYELASYFRLMRHREPTLRDWASMAAALVEYQFLPHYFGGVPRWRVALRKAVSARAVPDFAVVGPIKGGSSDLGVHLLSHPCVVPPLAKEVPDSNPDSWRPYYPSMHEMRRTAGRFGVSRSPYLGPFLHWVDLMDGLHSVSPRMPIVITLRNPVQRAYSHWKWDCFLAGKKRLERECYLKTFSAYVEHALDLFPSCSQSVCGFPLLEVGIYHKAVELWIKRFGRERVLVIDMATYFASRATVLDRIHDFLGIARTVVSDSPIINENPLSLPASDPSTNRLLSEFYRPYNERLRDLLGEDFGWDGPAMSRALLNSE